MQLTVANIVILDDFGKIIAENVIEYNGHIQEHEYITGYLFDLQKQYMSIKNSGFVRLFHLTMCDRFAFLYRKKDLSVIEKLYYLNGGILSGIITIDKAIDLYLIQDDKNKDKIQIEGYSALTLLNKKSPLNIDFEITQDLLDDYGIPENYLRDIIINEVLN